ncbi:MAG: outer membrane beta-barrel protein [Hyphomicrobiales bacterium]
MKRIISTLLFLTLSSISSLVFAQKFSGGVIGGVTASQVAGDNYSGYLKPGINVGTWLGLELTERSSLQMELSYIMKGSLFSVTKSDQLSYKLNLNYLQVPVLFQYRILDKIQVEGGLAASFLISHYEEYDKQELESENFKAISLSFLFGVSYQITDRVKLALMTNNDLTPIRKVGVRGSGTTRFGGDHGQFNDLLVFNLYYRL